MKKIYTLIISICSIFSINATDYLVSTNYTPGNVTEYQQRLFIPGVTLFSSISEVLNQIQPGDNIFLSADKTRLKDLFDKTKFQYDKEPTNPNGQNLFNV